MGDERRVFHCHFFRGIGMKYFLDLEILPFLCECYFLCGAEDNIFCFAEFGDGYGEVERLSLSIFGDGDTEIASGGGCPLIRLLMSLATIFPPEGDNFLQRCNSHHFAVPAVDVDDQFGESASVERFLWRRGDDVGGKDHRRWSFMSWDCCYWPFFFAFVEKIWPAMERKPFFLFFGTNTPGAIIGGIPGAFHVSPIIWGGDGVDFGEAVIDEGTVDFGFVEDLF